MKLLSSGIPRALFGVCALFLCLACASLGAPTAARCDMIPPMLRASSTPLLPDLRYFIDVTGTMDVEEAAAEANSQMFKPLAVKDLPRVTGVMWLRFTLAPLPAGGRSQAILLDMGADIPAGPVLYHPVDNPASDGVEWREITPSHRNVLLLPEPGAEPTTCYIRLDGLPGPWFAPTLRTPQDAASNWGSLSGTAALLALGVVMLLCLLRGLSEKGQWRIWTALYVGVALVQGAMGMPGYGSGQITLAQAMAVLAPGLALMLLPHVGRHLLRTRGRAPLLDAQFVLLSLPGAAVALLPLFPGFSWSIRFLSLWPACTLLFSLSALGGAIMGLGGSRRFLLGCLVPPLFVTAGIMGLDYGYAPNLLASLPLWGTALSALLIAGTGLPRDVAQTDADEREAANVKKATRKNPAALDAALTSSALSSGLDDGPIDLNTPLDDPNLRLLPPSSAGSRLLPDFSGLPEDISDASAPAPATPRGQGRNQEGGKESANGVDPGRWETLLRPPLDKLMREGAALGHCALPPAVRQYAENMLGAAGDLARIIDNPGAPDEQSGVGEQRSAFNLQHLVREAHDAVTAAAENAGIGLAWYMPPLLGHMYEGQAQALRETLGLLLESAVRATPRGAVHLSVRRVPETADPGHLLFTISDTGTGIPPRDRSSLALTRAWELSGSNNGYLNVECGPQGTSIAFTLRLKPLETETEETPTQEPRVPTVSVVAESAVDRQVLAHMITMQGCNSTEARSLQEALQCNKEAPALLLVTQYPSDGPSEADALGRFEAEALESGLPIFKALAITSDNRRWEALAETGYTHALLEPVDAEAFTATLREVLEEAAFPVSAPATPEPAPATDGEATPNTAEPAEGMPAANTAPAAEPAAQPERQPLPDLFGDAAPEPTQIGASPTPLAGDMPLPLLLEEPAASAADEPLELTDLLPPEEERTEAFAPLTFASTAAPDLATPPDTAPPDTATDAASDATQDQPATEHEDSKPALHGTSASEEPEAPTDREEPQPAGQEPASSTEETAPHAEAAPTSAAATEQGQELASELTPELTQQNEAQETTSQQATPPDVLAAIVADAANPDATPEDASDSVPDSSPGGPADVAPAGTDDAAEFMASAGLEGPLWAAETGPALATEQPATDTDGVAAADVPATAEPARASEMPEAPEATPPVAPEPASIEPATPAASAPQAEAVTLATPSFEAASRQAEAERSAPLEKIEWPDPAAATATTAHEVEQQEQGAPTAAAAAPTTSTPEGLKTLTDRAGEATLSPVNSAGGAADAATDFDVPAPAGRGAWDAYSLHDEWVGEPMPIGTPVARRPAPSAPAPVPSAPPVSPALAGEQQPIASPMADKKAYVSPSLAHPGEWVGEPMPMTKPATPEEPLPKAPQSQALQPERPEEERAQATEMPRTATGRLILKLLGNSGDRPPHADAPLQAEDPLPAAQTDLLPPQASAPVPPAAPAHEEPRRAATLRKSAASGNSIMNFIAGAAEALRGSPHEKTPLAENGFAAPDRATAKAPAQAVPTPRPTEPAPAPPAALVPPSAPRETDQTIPQLVARLDNAMDDAQKGFKNRRCSVVGEAAGRIATESDEFGFRVLARMARCVERAAKANDMNALRDLLPELAVAVERNRIGLTPRR